MIKGSKLSILAFGMILATILFGCSQNNPVTPLSNDGNAMANEVTPMPSALDGDCLEYDVSFRDTIIDIDYVNGTFTVANRTETITVDENTFIWLEIAGYSGHPDIEATIVSTTSGSGKATPQNYSYTRDSVLQFSDLKVGYVVEVRADIIDAATLLAGKIKVASCTYQEECFEFTDILASVDVSLRIVTFNTESWIGETCLNTTFTGLDGETLTLADFAVGDNVYVKGRILEGDTLRVNTLTKIE
ncbi:MAG: hypothetical protein ABIJ45_00335 [Candidatus Zixiibacteriota bacterium]